jgi:hypothetical protein
VRAEPSRKVDGERNARLAGRRQVGLDEDVFEGHGGVPDRPAASITIAPTAALTSVKSS